MAFAMVLKGAFVQKDFDVIIKNFFDSVYSYTGKVSAMQHNKSTQKKLAQGVATIHKIQHEIEEIQSLSSRKDRKVRVEDLFYLRVPMNNFIMPDSDDSAAYMAFSKVISIIVCSLQYEDVFNSDIIKESLNYWYSATSGIVGKNLQMSILAEQKIKTK